MNTKKRLFLILGILVAGLAVYFGFFHDKELPRPELKSPTPLVEPEDHKYSFDNPPVFEKDVELRFIDQKTKQIISEIDAEVADEHFERALGLMYRPEMADSTGMLFIFENETEQAFWMRNTIISLDIIYVNSDYEIVKIYKNTETLSDRSLPSGKASIYVVEVNAGYCDEHGIEEGDLVDF
ncbi:MAG: DUF192 domain-containing protein [Bacteroidota bacterium]